MNTERHSPSLYSGAILSRGDVAARRDATPQDSRFVHVFEALASVGIDARPAIYDESFADELRERFAAFIISVPSPNWWEKTRETRRKVLP